MKKMTKRITAILTAAIMLFTMAPVAFAGVEYSVEDAYYECAEIYPEFVNALLAQGVSDKQIITFLETLQEYLLNLDVEITEDNFEEYLIEAIGEAITLRKNIAVRDALIAAFPEAAVDGMDGIIHEDFVPIVETVKQIIFANGLLDKDESEEQETAETTEPTEKETVETTEPTEKETVAPTEPTEKETVETTEPTEKETDAPTEAPTASAGNTAGGTTGGTAGGGDDLTDEEATEVATEAATEPATEHAVKFTDMNQAAWAEEAVNALVGMGILSGYPDGTFLPNKSITRAEFAKIIVLASGRYDKDAKCSFKDVKESDWFYSYVASAYELGFITGRSADVFDPNSNITRADLCTVVYRFIKSVNSEFKTTGTASFTDGDKIPSYAQEAVNALYSAGVVGGMGDGKFEPLAPATRAQSAKIIYGALNAAFGF